MPSMPVARQSGHVQVATRLQTYPELPRRSEIACQSQRGVDRIGAASKHDFVQSQARHLDVAGQPMDSEARRFQKLVTQDLAGMHERPPASRSDVREVNAQPVRFLSGNGHVQFGSR